MGNKIFFGKILKEGDKFTVDGKEMFCFPADFSGNLACSVCGKTFYCEYMWGINQKFLDEEIQKGRCEACSEDSEVTEISDMVRCGDTFIGLIKDKE